MDASSRRNGRESATPDVVLVTPPFVQLNTPYAATPALTGWLEEHGVAVWQRDLSLEVALDALRAFGDDFADEAIEILQNRHLPPEAKEEVTRHVDGLARAIRDEIDPDFGFSRYAEKLCASLPDFGALLKRLRRHSPIDRLLEARVDALLGELGLAEDAAAGAPRSRGSVGKRKRKIPVFGVTCPFPGTLLGAFRVAERIRRRVPEARIVLGGGFVNTELRDMTDRRPYRYFDAILYDEGYAPTLKLLAAWGVPCRGADDSVPPFVKPSYRGLDLSQYLDLPETSNPMHRLWSTGRWLKVQLARGCYWHKCAFCDVSLDYVKCFAMPKPETVADALEALARETGVSDFHFTDEAMPPALVAGLSREILRRKFACRWWGNVRFDAAFTPALARLMARAGCIAVSGGLECANDRLLKLMNKGVTRQSARAALEAFADAGIMAHAYLMYAFPTETEREARGALGWVRDLFRAGLVQSAFFHRFALTVHSPVARDPARFGIEVPDWKRPTKRPRFALNEIPFREPGAPDWTRIGKALSLALYNYMEGRGLSKPVSFWFKSVG